MHGGPQKYLHLSLVGRHASNVENHWSIVIHRRKNVIQWLSNEVLLSNLSYCGRLLPPSFAIKGKYKKIVGPKLSPLFFILQRKKTTEINKWSRAHLFQKLKLRCDKRFTHAFTVCCCVYKVITLVGSNQGNYFENARWKRQSQLSFNCYFSYFSLMHVLTISTKTS
jgi:hypothetical protein